MKYNYKKYNKRILTALLTVLAILALLNFIVDPFYIFKIISIENFNKYKPEIKRQVRITKIIDLKLTKEPVSAIFVGSSRTDGSFDPEYYKKLTGKTAKNMAMQAISNSESIKLIKGCLKIHPEIDTVYLGLDFFRFNKREANSTKTINISDNPKLTLQEFNPVILSFDTIYSSVATVISNAQGIKQMQDNGLGIVVPNPNIFALFYHRLSQYKETYKNYDLSLDEINKIKDFVEYCKKNKINLVLFINPIHTTQIDVIYEVGVWNEFEKWKTELAKVTPFYDFVYVNKINSEKITPDMKYFFESSHCTRNLGNLEIARMTGKINDYGLIVNQGNVQELNHKNKMALLRWQADNTVLVNNIKELKGE